LRDDRSPDPTRAELEASLRGLHEESGGLLHLDIVLQADLPDLTLAVMCGEAGAQILFGQVVRAVADVHGAPRKSPKVCGSCPRRVRRGDHFSVAIATPVCDDPTNALALVICRKCGTDRVAVQAAAALGVRKIWPDLRDVLITHSEGGRA